MTPDPSLPSTRGLQVSAEDDEIDLMALLAALWSGKFWIVLALTFALSVGAFVTLRGTPLYQAQALLQLETRSGALALPEGMQELLGGATGGKSPGEAEMEIMRSRMVMSEAAQALDLQINAAPRPLPVFGLLPARLALPDMGWNFLKPYQWGNEAIEVGELAVPEAWLGVEFILRIIGPDQFALILPGGEVFEGTARQRLTLTDTGFSLVVDRLEGPVGREFLLSRRPLSQTVRSLQTRFAVSETPRGSSILQLRFNDPDPRQAERILDAVAQVYVSQNIARSAVAAQNSLTFIDEQLPEAEVAVAMAQNALNAYRQSQRSVDVDYETRSILERATAIETQLSALALEEEDLKDRYTVNHPAYRALLQSRATLEAQLEALRDTSAGLPETQKEIFNLTRDLEVAQQVYVQLLNRQQELRVVRASTVGSVRIIDTAWASDIRIAPRSSRILALSAVIGLIVGVGAVLLRRALRRGIRGAQEIEASGLPVFATVPFAAAAVNHRNRKGALPILALTQPDDPVIEALRSLRTSLHFGMLDAQTNTIVITSAAPLAGKSFTAVNLAVVAAQAGQKVCLIDADLRRGYIRRYFGQARGRPGLADYLAQEKPLEEVLGDGPVPGLSVMTTGRFPPNPSELLMRASFAELLAILDARFDLVIVDSPPALAVTDPVIIGRQTGARIMVARHLETMLGEVEAVRRAFEAAGTRLTGAILNGYKAAEGSRYGGQYHAYNYRYSYQRDPEDAS